jgi:hypothetical protein
MRDPRNLLANCIDVVNNSDELGNDRKMSMTESLNDLIKDVSLLFGGLPPETFHLIRREK